MMRLLKILTFTFCILFTSPMAFAQSVQPKFGISWFLGVPTSNNFVIRDIFEVRGLTTRFDFGISIWSSLALHLALDVEYHFAEVYGTGFYFGLGLIGQKILTIGEFAPPTEPPWMLGFQTYVGFEFRVLFVELGFSKNFLNSVGWSDFLPRIVVGLQLYF